MAYFERTKDKLMYICQYLNFVPLTKLQIYVRLCCFIVVSITNNKSNYTTRGQYICASWSKIYWTEV